ncbi:toll/interleukin-1 receptor domain-containing protein [Klebsiella variicola]|uniref:toll/interleukin-1 receptor domain-containing protein n=1 Tax=Klebsiella variicola TaxID=244366 RepID=UPI000E2D61A5|nr:toll/interleukin-1 receptor domain-containing protein [Klebsiella variicola]SXF37084.1 Flp pilus assembly protein TadD, contains TPR repeats [Klebsiella variicola]
MSSLFLSLSFVDVNFVKNVYERLPHGLARYYEKSFDRGEDLISAMEKSLDNSDIFVLFASRRSLSSYAVNFEIEEARRRIIFNKMKKLYVFPLEPSINFQDLPEWMHNYWVPNSGYSPFDIARYLTTILLEPNSDSNSAVPDVIGRGALSDSVRRLSAFHFSSHKEMPKIYIFPGITGIGRRTFSSYFQRNALSSLANLRYGPTITLSAQAELVDLYRALRVEIDSNIKPSKVLEEQELFIELSEDEKIDEVIRVTNHFTKLGQSITIISTAGFFGDHAIPKKWVKPFFQRIPQKQLIFIISNIQFKSEFIDELGVAVQCRVDELADEDIKTLMILTADLLKVSDFKISDDFIRAIGGHPDVANAGVRLAKQKGTAILEKDPSQLFNIQKLIINESIRAELLLKEERIILDVLSWLPNLSADLLEKIVVDELHCTVDSFNTAIESLILGCLIYASGWKYSIASSVRYLYRRHNITDKKTLTAMGSVFEKAWNESKEKGFRDDLFSAFIFMQVLEGKSLPDELRRLMTASNIYEMVKNTYAQGKSIESDAVIEQAIKWGKIAFNMQMEGRLHEEILSIVARAQIRLEQYPDAHETISYMKEKGYRQYSFLEGHYLRKRREFTKAIPILKFYLSHNPKSRSAVHELAICYRRERQMVELEILLKKHKNLISESAELLDFNIALHISRGEMKNILHLIEQLRDLDINSNRADLRYAQYLAKAENDLSALNYLSDILKSKDRDSKRLRSARAVYAARSGDSNLAREDLAMLRSIKKNDLKVESIECEILISEGKPFDAYKLHNRHSLKDAGDWFLRSRILDAIIGSSDIGISELKDYREERRKIKSRYDENDSGLLFDE